MKNISLETLIVKNDIRKCRGIASVEREGKNYE